MKLPDGLDPADIERFLATHLYEQEAFLVDEIVEVDRQARSLRARLDTASELPIARYQRTGPGHPAHVSVAEMLMPTGSLGCLHAWIFHGCRWDEGWSGFGSRIHRADFKQLARLGAPLELASRETRTRVGERRVVLRYEFRFEQEGELVYPGDQTAMFLEDADL